VARVYQYEAYTQAIEFLETSATTPDQWTPYGPTQFRSRLPQRDTTADVRLSGFEATALREWAPSLGRQFRLQLLQRDNTADVRISGFEATNIIDWAPYGPTQFRLRPSQRDSTVDVRISGFEATLLGEWEPRAFRVVPRAVAYHPDNAQLLQLVVVGATSPEEWLPYPPTQFRIRLPQRDTTADVRISGFEAIRLEAWEPRAIRRVPRAVAYHPDTAQLLQLLVVGATSPDQWHPYGPTQFRLRFPQRDNTADVRVSGFEATNIRDWAPHGPTQFRLRLPQRDDTADLRISGFEATSLDEWQALPWRQFRLRRPQRDDTAGVRISGFEATDLEEWDPRFVRRVPRAVAYHPEIGELIQLVVAVAATTPEEWLPYGPIQFRLRVPQRDYSSYILEIVEGKGLLITSLLIVAAVDGTPATTGAVDGTLEIV